MLTCRQWCIDPKTANIFDLITWLFCVKWKLEMVKQTIGTRVLFTYVKHMNTVNTLLLHYQMEIMFLYGLYTTHK